MNSCMNQYLNQYMNQYMNQTPLAGADAADGNQHLMKMITDTHSVAHSQKLMEWTQKSTLLFKS